MTFRPPDPPGQHADMVPAEPPASSAGPQPLADPWRPLERELRRQQGKPRRRRRLRDVMSRMARLAIRLQ